MQRHQRDHAFIVLALKQPLTPDLGGLKRHLQHLAADGGFVVERGDTVDVGFAETLDNDGGSVGWHRFFIHKNNKASQCRVIRGKLAKPAPASALALPQDRYTP